MPQGSRWPIILRSSGIGAQTPRDPDPIVPSVSLGCCVLSAVNESSDSPALVVDSLSVEFATLERTVRAVRNVSFEVGRGETVAIVGESGSGKSVTALSLMRLVEHGGGRITSGRLDFERRDGRRLDLAQAFNDTMRSIRGGEIAMIFQEPMTSLNPVFTIGEQIAESIRLHQGKDRAAARAEALRMLELVRIPAAAHVLTRHPHQLSGGMRQRVMIAMALSCRPSLLIADEPTTALDVTIQAQILALIGLLQDEMRMAVLFITHDMGVVAEVADRVLVMWRGEKVEEGPVEQIFASPEHPYTRMLLSAVPRLGSMHGTDAPKRFPLVHDDANAEVPSPAWVSQAAGRKPLLKVRGLKTRFDLEAGLFGRVTRRVHAVEQVSFDLHAGETLALVGESGCGKSTTARSLLRLVDVQSGSIELEGRDIAQLPASQVRPVRRDIQMIFQDPFASLDPRLTVGFSIAEPLHVHGVARGRAAEERVAWLLRQVGLSPDHAQRYPHEFSGGQRQRIARRTRAGAQSEDHHRGRSRVVARRFDPGADRQPAARPAERARSFLPVHLARHGGGRTGESPRRGHVPGPDRRDRTAAGDLRKPAAPLYP